MDMLHVVQYNTNAREPYDQTECRLGLYELMLELCLAKHSCVPAPLSKAIYLFKNGFNDYSPQVNAAQTQNTFCQCFFFFSILNT